MENNENAYTEQWEMIATVDLTEDQSDFLKLLSGSDDTQEILEKLYVACKIHSVDLQGLLDLVKPGVF